MMSSEAERLMNEAHMSVSACIMNDIPNDARQAFGRSAYCFINALGAKLEEALAEVRHLRTNAVGPPDYMRLKVRAEEAEKIANSKVMKFHRDSWREYALEERTRIVKLARQSLEKLSLQCNCRVTVKGLIDEIERSPGD